MMMSEVSELAFTNRTTVNLSRTDGLCAHSVGSYGHGMSRLKDSAAGACYVTSWRVHFFVSVLRK
jgi:hypothetical protein